MARLITEQEFEAVKEVREGTEQHDHYMAILQKLWDYQDGKSGTMEELQAIPERDMELARYYAEIMAKRKWGLGK
ncbi:MAG: hypothetical protein HC819_12755 [Cyclobacteriaceae bacterium]|nr:hypothetical protein [Cyclobacteriaceae bacterium]